MPQGNLAARRKPFQVPMAQLVSSMGRAQTKCLSLCSRALRISCRPLRPEAAPLVLHYSVFRMQPLYRRILMVRAYPKRSQRGAQLMETYLLRKMTWLLASGAATASSCCDGVAGTWLIRSCWGDVNTALEAGPRQHMESKEAMYPKQYFCATTTLVVDMSICFATG